MVEGFNVTDRISVVVSPHPDVVKAVEGYGEYIKSETLAESLEVGEVRDGEEIVWLDDSKFQLDAALLTS